MKHLISIIVPIYQSEKHIEKCVNSLLSQSYTNVEIILINDGSKDSSGLICDKFALIDKRVKVFHKINGGVSDARNFGLKNVKGQYITFVDSDDWVSEDYIERLLLLSLRFDSEITICNFEKVVSDSVVSSEYTNNYFEVLSNLTALEYLCGQRHEQFTVPWGKLYKTELFTNISYPVGKIHEDEFISFRLLHKATKIVVTSEKLLFYRQHSESIMGKGFNIYNRLNAIEAFQSRASFFHELKLFKLRNLTLKSLSGMYVSILQNIEKFDNLEDKSKFSENIKYFYKHVLALDIPLTYKIYMFTNYKVPFISKLLYLFRHR